MAWKPPRYRTFNGVPHTRIRSGAYRRIHQIVDGVLDGAAQIKTWRKWKWVKGPRKRTRQAAKTQKPPALLTPKVEVQTRPRGYEIIVWTYKYHILKQHAAVPQKSGRA
jgi:hypothetical protein